VEILSDKTKGQLAHAHLNTQVANLKRNTGYHKVHLSIDPSKRQESLSRDGLSGPISDWRPDLPGDEGQPTCVSYACDKPTRAVKPGMYVRILGLDIFHPTCSPHRSQPV
jgi:hypothetical protein